MALSLHTNIVYSLQRCQDVSIACATVAFCSLVGLYLLRPRGPFWTKQQQLGSLLATPRPWYTQSPPPPIETSGDFSESSASTPEEWDSLSEKSASTGTSASHVISPVSRATRRKAAPARLIIKSAPEDVYLPSLLSSPSLVLPPAQQAHQQRTSSTDYYAYTGHRIDSFPPETRQPSLIWESRVYGGAVTKGYQDSFREYKDRRRPVALTVTVCPSDDPRVMQARYADLCTFLTSDILVNIASLIHSLDITFPSSSGFIFESVAHPYDNSDAAYLGFSDFHDPMRYKNEFPNLVEFGWSGALGRRRGDGTYAALPAPFHDLLSLPYAQMRRLEFKRCLMTLSDCCMILDSARKTIETFVADTVIGTSLDELVPGVPAYPPALWPAPGAQVPIRGYPTFSWATRPDDTGDEGELQCESLRRLELKTTADLVNFFSMLDAPKLAHFTYEPIGRLAYVTKSNFPWYSIGPALRSLVVGALGIEREAVEVLEQCCEEEEIEVRFCPPSRA